MQCPVVVVAYISAEQQQKTMASIKLIESLYHVSRIMRVTLINEKSFASYVSGPGPGSFWILGRSDDGIELAAGWSGPAAGV